MVALILALALALLFHLIHHHPLRLRNNHISAILRGKMHTNSFLHRHFVAAPLLPVFLAGSLFLSGTHAPVASIQNSPGEASEIIQHLSGNSALVDPGSLIDFSGDVPELREGALRIMGKGIVRLRVGSAELLGLVGGFHAVKRDETITVSALGTPVLVTYGSHHVLVPVGKQWRGDPTLLPDLASGVRVWKDARSPQTLPAVFLESEHARLMALSTEVPVRLPPSRTHAPLSPLKPSILRFAAANKRAGQKWTQHVLGYVRSLVEHDDTAALDHLLQEPDVVRAFAPTPTLEQAAASLLSLTSEAPIKLALMPLLQSCERCMTVAAAHPALQSTFWAVPPPLGSDEETNLARLLALPTSDVLAEGVPGFAVERWQAQLEEYFQKKVDPYPLLNVIALDIAMQVDSYEAQGHPERARRYGSAVLALTKDKEEHLSSELLRALDRLRKLDTVQIHSNPEEEAMHAAASSSAAPPAHPTTAAFVPEEVQRRATTMLKQAGALFSLKTTVTGTDASHAHVEDILFPTPQGDLLFAFDVNLVTGEVESILHEGQLLPFPMPLDKFVSWLQEARNSLIPAEVEK